MIYFIIVYILIYFDFSAHHHFNINVEQSFEMNLINDRRPLCAVAAMGVARHLLTEKGRGSFMAI